MSGTSGSQAERYTQRDNAPFDLAMTERTAASEAAFFLPHLGPTMRLLDVGCGPGTITIGFADLVGEVVGVDVRPEPLAQARVRAEESHRTNVRFETGSVYELPFADNTFEAAFAHVVMMHLADPVAALREMYRVLRPGGVVGVRDPDLGTVVTFPPSALQEQWTELRGSRSRSFGPVCGKT